MFSKNFGHRLAAAGIAISSSLVSFASGAAGQDTLFPLEFLFGIRAGDSYESILSQQGWYACGNAKRQAACFDEARVLGQVGKYEIGMVEGRAYLALFTPSGPHAFWRTVRATKTFNDGVSTLVEFHTKNADIDVIKAVHDLGSKEALNRFSRYLADGNPNLQRLTIVPMEPPPETAFPEAKAYLRNLPLGAVEISVSLYFDELTIVSFLPSASQRRMLFPGHCIENCEAAAPDGNK
ncbi:hypothetical protein FHX06_000151 [Rhizobium sp. BK512]|uniref:hypothetical protein n=1 Tax=Rhizobium sp. BK512 TaxID=2587010 RepID=UPI000DDDBDB4|nr:hypothetical protein [Rhizobium sp. BK512]MBB3558854.1 hypothetical protein [Rhizobium sp. BK512]